MLEPIRILSGLGECFWGKASFVNAAAAQDHQLHHLWHEQHSEQDQGLAAQFAAAELLHHRQSAFVWRHSAPRPEYAEKPQPLDWCSLVATHSGQCSPSHVLISAEQSARYWTLSRAMYLS